MSKATVLKPRMSEKAYGLSETQRTYIFDIPARANRHSIMKAIADQFEVGVESVRISKAAGKTKRTYRRRGRVFHKGQTSSVRKAYVTLKEGDKLPLFAAAEESDKKADAKEKK